MIFRLLCGFTELLGSRTAENLHYSFILTQAHTHNIFGMSACFSFHILHLARYVFRFLDSSQEFAYIPLLAPSKDCHVWWNNFTLWMCFFYSLSFHTTGNREVFSVKLVSQYLHVSMKGTEKNNNSRWKEHSW